MLVFLRGVPFELGDRILFIGETALGFSLLKLCLVSLLVLLCLEVLLPAAKEVTWGYKFKKSTYTLTSLSLENDC